MREARWPRSTRWPGLAHGWQGAAWIVFQHERAGQPMPARMGAGGQRRRLGASSQAARALASEYGSMFMRASASLYDTSRP